MNDSPIHLSAGDRLRTVSGRIITAPRLVGRLEQRLKQLDAWLHAEALSETAPRCAFSAAMAGADFQQTLVQGMQAARLSPADRDLLNELLFGDERGARACHRVSAG